MASCNIIRNDKGAPVYTEAPNGERSNLFDSLMNKLQNPTEALNTWLVSRTKDFKESVLNPILQRGIKKQVEVTSPIKVQNSELIFEPRVNPITGQDTGQLELVLIKTNPEDRGQGLAKKAIGKFLDYADTVKKPAYLTVSPRESGVTESGLIKLYQSFGFKLLPSGFEMVRPVGNRQLPKVLQGLDENGEPKMELLLNYINNKSEELEEEDGTFEVDLPEDIDEEIEKIKAQRREIDLQMDSPDAMFDEFQELNKKIKNLQLYKEGKYYSYEAIDEVAEQLNDLNKPYKKEVKTTFSTIKTNVFKLDKVKEDVDLGGIYNTEVNGYLFRGVSLEDYKRIKEQGYIDTDLRGAISDREGINLATDARTSFNYLPEKEEGVVLVIDVSDKSSLFQIGADDYVRASRPIPFTDVKMVTTPSIGMAYTAIKGGKVTPVKIKKVNHNQESLSTKTKVEVKEVMMGLRVKSSEELLNKLQVGFMSEGYFNPSRDSLYKAGIYTNEEIIDIMSNPTLQDSIKSFIFKLSNIEQNILNDGYVDENFLVIEDGSKNGIGKFKLANPYLVEKETIEILGGVNTREEFEEILFNDDRVERLRPIYIENQGTSEDLFNYFREFKEIAEIEYEEGQLTAKTNNTKEYFNEVLIEPTNKGLEANLSYLLSVDDSILEEKLEDIKPILEEIQTQLIEIGVDSTQMLDLMEHKSIEEFKSFAVEVLNFLEIESDNNYDKFINAYNEFFDVDNSFKYKKVPLQRNISESNSFYLETVESNMKSFSEVGLIPVGKNVFKRVDKNQSLEELYEEIYTQTITNGYNPILPEEAFIPSGFDDSGTLSISKLTDINNKNNIIRDIQAYIQSEIVKLNTGEQSFTKEDLEKYVLLFNYYNKSNDYNKFKETPDINAEYAIFTSDINNQEYLKTDFIADFNKKLLKEKLKNSQEYQEFYSNFEIDKLGVRLRNTDPITLSKIESYLNENKDLVNYLNLHKNEININLDTNLESQLEDKVFSRNLYSNYPELVKPFKGDYNQLSNDALTADTKEPFIKVSTGVYEIIGGIGSKGVYGKLNEIPGVYKSYNKNLRPPELSIEISELTAIDTNIDADIEINNLYDTNEENQINNEYDNC